MQFDEKDLEKDDNNFSLEEDDSISWEDLLNAEEDEDLSSLVKEEVEPKEEKKTSSIADFDINSVVEETPKEEVTEAKQETEIESADDDSLDLLADIQEESVVAEENEPEAPTTNEEEPLKFLDDPIVEEVSVDSLPQVEDAKEETVSDDISFLEDAKDASLDDFLMTSDDKLLIEQESDSELANSANVEGVVDDELLSLLSDDSSKTKAADAADMILGGIANSSEQETYEENQADFSVLDDTPAPISADVQEENILDSTDEVYVAEDVPAKKGSNKGVLALFGLIFIGALIGAAYFALNYFGLLNGILGSGDLETNNDSNYGIETPVEAPQPAQPSPEVVQQEQANKLINKVANKDKKTEVKKEEKKVVVVQVPVSGRANPFLPSSLFDDRGFASYGSDITLPPEVEIDSPEMIAARKLLTISVSGIMYDPNKPSAILRFDGMDYFVQKGDRIDDYIVQQVTKDYVAISNGTNVYKAYVGEAFKIKENPITPKNQIQIKEDGTRQYISAGDIQIQQK